MAKDPTRRFSGRVENYIKYRPGYPAELIDLLRNKCQLTQSSIIADIGSGTGILTRPLLDNGYAVFGVEPNREMREAGEDLLRGYDHFTSIDGSAESTTLPDQSVDLITAGQAFHWFDRIKTKSEFRRIIRQGGWIALIWNERLITSSPFLAAYEKLLQDYAPEYILVDHRNVNDDKLKEFFAPEFYETATFPNHQDFDYEGLEGRLLSSSYVPNLGDPNSLPMVAELQRIYAKYNVDGKVRIEHMTRIHYAQIAK